MTRNPEQLALKHIQAICQGHADALNMAQAAHQLLAVMVNFQTKLTSFAP